MQRFFEVFVNEKEYTAPRLLSLKHLKSFNYDLSDSQFAWVVEFYDPVTKIEVKLDDGTWYTVNEATSQLDLFDEPRWAWSKFSNRVVLTGFDIVNQPTELRSGNWQFIKYSELWDPNGMVWIEHPDSKNWIPLHPLHVREDGMMHFNYSGTTRVRNRNYDMGYSLDSFEVRLNGDTVSTARRVDLWNSVDSRALVNGIYRRPGESNEDFANSLLVSNWFAGETNTALRDSLSARLRQGLLTSIPASSTSFSVPASATGYSIRNIQQYAYLFEQNAASDPDSVDGFRSMFASPELGYANLYGQLISFTSSGGVYKLDTYVDNSTTSVDFYWRVKYWTESGSTVSFTTNFPKNVPDLLIYFPSNVVVSNGSTKTMIKSFNRTSPSFKWHAFKDAEEEGIRGLAEFV